jgi:4-hydroxybutyrate CoA-transferase
MAKKNLDIDWRKYYQDKLITVEEAAKQVENGDGLWMGQATQLPYKLLDEMYARKEEYDYQDIKLLWNCANVPFDMLFDPGVKERFTLSSIFCLPLERMSGGMDVMEYTHGCYDLLDYWVFENGANSFAVHICPPDENGYCNYGAYGVGNSASISQDPRVTKKYAFIDHSQFSIPGNRDRVAMHITEFDYIIEDDQEFFEIPAQLPTEIDKKIASYILPYINPGDKVEIGFGGLGEEILANLKEIGQMKIFSEVACDNMKQLMEEGVLTEIVAGSPGACSEEFFEFVATNEKVKIIPDHIKIGVVAAQENLVAINATFMMDLLGQACSESQGLKPYSGAGGSLAFIYGSLIAPGGKSFICLRSTHTDSEGNLKSNIVPWLPEGSIVTTPKNYQMYVVTEYGIADIFLKSFKQRIKALIKIAHPQFRKELRDKICTTPLISEADFDDEFNKFIENPPDANEAFKD